MNSTLEPECHLRADDVNPVPVFPDDCCRLIKSAEKELGAFLGAVTTLYGEIVAMGAAECWVALVGSSDIATVNGVPNWRHITILASSRLANGSLLQQTQHRLERGKRC